MKQEHDFEGALEALQRVAIAVCGVDYRTQAAFEGDIQTIRAALTAAKCGTKNDWRIIQDWCLDKGLTLVESEAQELANLLDKPPQDGGDDG